MVEKDLKGYQMIDALSSYGFFEKGVVSQPICSVDHIQPFLENVLKSCGVITVRHSIWM